MSFGSPFGGFGASNNNQQQPQQTSGFGGFGANNTANNNPTGGFGTTNTTSGFGASNTNAGGSLFGGANAASSGFSGFGANANTNNNQQSSAFGQPRPFGSPATTGGSLFGGNTGTSGTSGFGGFGNSANTSNTTATPGFGSGSGGGLFGGTTQTNTGFGNSTGGGGLFGAQQNQTPGFGNSNTSTTSTGFGQTTTPGFGTGTQTQNNGTGGTPFTPHSEKDTNNSSQTQHYQSITCQPQYANFQFEELRTVDYNQGRKYGNQSGQAGAFGANTGFGGFGPTNNNNNATTTTPGFGANSGSSLFGQPQNQAQGFGSGTTASGFGTSTSGGGLFGAKPATTGGLFGNTAPATGQQTGGLFGGSTFGANNNNSSGFGNNAASGGGLFGQSQANNQPKPGGIFGTSTATNNSFGASNTTSGFGTSTTGGGLFGNTNTQQTNTGGAFGQPQSGQTGGLFGQAQNQNQNQTTPQTGGLFGGSSTFGNQNQQKPGGLFGGSTTTTTGGGLFGNNNQQQQQQPGQGGGLFSGINNQNNQSGGLFGQQQQQKPSLFGNAATTSNSGGGLFGNSNNQTQQNQGGGLFGNLNQNQPKPGGLFGSTITNTNGGGGLFGNTTSNTNNQQNTGSSLFGASNQNQQPQLGSSLFGSMQQQNQQPQQQPQQLNTSILAHPYGNEHLFVSLSTPSPAVGPLMTPLSSSQKLRRPMPLPTYRLNPNAASRLLTPQKRSGYGFDYSAYGTPGSAYSNATPPTYGRSLLGGGSFGRSLGRSLSATNLRGAYGPEESILSPGAFSPGGMGSGSSSMKKLKINRGLRTDLFGADGPTDSTRSSPLKKTVSFETNGGAKTLQPNGEPASSVNGEASNALVRVEDTDTATPSAEEQGYLRTSRRSQPPTTASGGAVQQEQEMEQVKGNELAVVPEDSTPIPEAPAVTAKTSMSAEDAARFSQKDMEPGAYYMIPSKEAIEKMSRKDRSMISPFVVGRENTGKIEFDQVDLSNVDLDKVLGDIVQITQRSATVYPNHANKPPQGKGMNFPARITLDNSWPRSKGGKVPVFERKGPRFEKHLERLKRVAGTEFEQYVVEKGQWIFRVPHFSTYALDYSDDDDMLGIAPTNLSTRSSAFISPLSDKSRLSQRDLSFSNSSPGRDSNPDDTFEFRTSKSVPGAFDGGFVSDEEADMTQGEEGEPERNDSASPEMTESREATKYDFQPNSSLFGGDLPSAGPFDGAIDDDSPRKHSEMLISPIKPKSILKASRRVNLGTGAQSALHVPLGGDWASQLQRTLSPKKQNRQTLRESQGVQGQRQRPDSGSMVLNKDKNPFATSMDIMNSLFAPGKSTSGGRQVVEGKGFQLPYAKRNRPDPDIDMTETDRAFHQSFKPSWAFDGTFIYSASGPAEDGTSAKARISFEGNDNDFGCFAAIQPAEASNSLREQQSVSVIVMDDGCPRAHMSNNFDFSSLADVVEHEDASATHEKLMWRLASALFDDVSSEHEPELERKEILSEYWTKLVQPAMNGHLKLAKDGNRESSELALIRLTGHDIENATATLIDGKNYRLSTMIAQIGGDETMRSGFETQIEEWRRTNALSEISASIRSLYELLAGNTCTAIGKSGVGAEDKTETFNISQRLGLDWRRSFGLRLWYGTRWEEDTLADAIKAYARDLASFKEEVMPLPWFLEQGIDTGWDDPRTDERQDILLGLLKIYALNYELARDDNDDFLTSRVKLADIISPQNVTGNPTDAGLSFQLYHALSTKEIIDFPEDERHHKADLLAMDYAFQLSADRENLFDAIFVILHLTEASAREAAVKALLNRHTAAIEDAETGKIFSRLVTDLKIPPPWIWAAKALYAKAVAMDQRQECYCLLKAGEDYLQQAHETLRRVLAPKCIIEEDLTTLREVLEWFGHVGADRMKGWESGGGLYADYIRLLDVARHGDKNEVRELVKKMGHVLAAAASGPLSLDERVAVTEMANGMKKAVEEVDWKTGGIDTMNRAAAFPKMPAVARDATLKQAMKLSESYYSSVSVGGQ